MLQKPLRRVPIEEIGIEETENQKRFKHKLESDIARETVRNELDAFDKFIPKELSTVGHDETNNGNHCSDKLVFTSNTDSLATAESASPVRVMTYGHLCETERLTNIPVVRSDIVKFVAPLAAPSNSFQFQAEWKILKNNAEEFFAYFKVKKMLKYS